jgi:hypothetical protein
MTLHKSPGRSLAICSSQTLSHCRHGYLTNPVLSAIDIIQTRHGFLTPPCSVVLPVFYKRSAPMSCGALLTSPCLTSDITDHKVNFKESSTVWTSGIHLYRLLCKVKVKLSLYGSEWSDSSTGRFISGVRAPGAHWIGGWVDPRAVLDTVAKRKEIPLLHLPGIEPQPSSP